MPNALLGTGLAEIYMLLAVVTLPFQQGRHLNHKQHYAYKVNTFQSAVEERHGYAMSVHNRVTLFSHVRLPQRS